MYECDHAMFYTGYAITEAGVIVDFYECGYCGHGVSEPVGKQDHPDGKYHHYPHIDTDSDQYCDEAEARNERDRF